MYGNIGDCHWTNIPTFKKWCFFLRQRVPRRSNGVFNRFFHVVTIGPGGFFHDCLLYIFRKGLLPLFKLKEHQYILEIVGIPLNCRDRLRPVMFLVLGLGHWESCNTVDGSEIPNNHLSRIKPCKYWDKLPTSTGERRISEPSTVLVPSIVELWLPKPFGFGIGIDSRWFISSTYWPPEVSQQFCSEKRWLEVGITIQNPVGWQFFRVHVLTSRE